jgi:hypothetical protein
MLDYLLCKVGQSKETDTELNRWSLNGIGKKQRFHASPDTCPNLRQISGIKLTAGWLIGPNVSKATGW